MTIFNELHTSGLTKLPLPVPPDQFGDCVGKTILLFHANKLTLPIVNEVIESKEITRIAFNSCCNWEEEE